MDQEDRVEDLPAERQARRIGNNEVGCRSSRPSPGEADGTGGDIDRSHAPGLPGECGEGLPVPAPEFQDGGTCREVGEGRCTTPEVSPSGNPRPRQICVCSRISGRCRRWIRVRAIRSTQGFEQDIEAGASPNIAVIGV